MNCRILEIEYKYPSDSLKRLVKTLKEFQKYYQRHIIILKESLRTKEEHYEHVTDRRAGTKVTT